MRPLPPDTIMLSEANACEKGYEVSERFETAYRLLAAASAIACTSAIPAVAQGATSQPADAPAPVSDDVVVSERCVSERLRDVSVDITAGQGGKLDSLCLRTAVDLRQAVPGVQVTYSAGRAAPPAYMIRGRRAYDTLLTLISL